MVKNVPHFFINILYYSVLFLKLFTSVKFFKIADRNYEEEKNWKFPWIGLIRET